MIQCFSDNRPKSKREDFVGNEKMMRVFFFRLQKC